LPPRSAADAITPALEHTKSQLFRPFRWPQWWRLALVGTLAGELSSGGVNLNIPRFPATHSHGTSQEAFLAALPPAFAEHPVLVAWLILALIVIGLVLIVVFSYILSVMRFILFDSVATRECHIRQGWRRRKQIGLRFFWWQISVAAISFVTFAISIGVPLALAWGQGWFDAPRDHLPALILGGFTFLILLFLEIAALVLIRVVMKDFVVPQMALEGIGPVEGWRRILARMKSEKTGYAGYIGMKFVLALAAAFLFTIVMLLAILLLMIPIAGVAIAAIFAGQAAGLTWSFFTIAIAVVYACVALAICIAAAALAGVPVIVFFPAYAMYFFAPRYPPLADLLWPNAPAPAAPQIPPTQNPPLPPSWPPPDAAPLPQ
jgi:hypothetical protein